MSASKVIFESVSCYGFRQIVRREGEYIQTHQVCPGARRNRRVLSEHEVAKAVAGHPEFSTVEVDSRFPFQSALAALQSDI